MAEPKMDARAKGVIALAASLLELIRDVILLSFLSFLSTITGSLAMGVISLIVFGLVAIKYLSKAVESALGFGPLADRTRDNRVRLAVIFAIIALVPAALLVGSYAFQSQLRSGVVYVAALGRP